MTFLLDTGSAWLWLANEDCPAEQCRYDHYEYHLSSSYSTEKKPESVKYAAGAIEGYVAADHVALTKSPATQAQDVNFLSIYQITDMGYL